MNKKLIVNPKIIFTSENSSNTEQRIGNNILLDTKKSKSFSSINISSDKNQSIKVNNDKTVNKRNELLRLLNNNSSNLKQKFEQISLNSKSSQNLLKINFKSTNNLKDNYKSNIKNLSSSNLNDVEKFNNKLNLSIVDSKSDDNIIIIGNRNKTKHELATGYGFNEDQIGIFEETFQLFDKDSDGFITLIEIRTVMNALGFFPGDDIIRKGIQDIDNDNSGTVDFEEFICMMSKFRTIKNNNELDDELREIFKIFDKNQDGFIDRVELKDVLIRLGENITDDEVADMIKEADIDGDNKVSFSEFKSILYDSKAR